MDKQRPLYIRLSVTDFCDMRCFYCMPEDDVERLRHDEVLRYEEIERFCRLLAEHLGLRKIRLTGGEPLVRRALPDLVAMLAAIPGIEELALTTNAQRLAPMAATLRRAGLDRVNISLDTLRPDRFRELCRGGELEATLEGIRAAQEAGLQPVRTNTVLLAGVNDDELVDLVDFGLAQDVEVRFIELMPIGQAARHVERHFLSASAAIDRIATRFDLTETGRRRGGTAREFLARRNGRQTRIGIIESMSEPFCGDCNRLRLTSNGQLRWCLMKDEGLDVRSLLRDGAGEQEIVDAVASGLAAKRVPACRRAASLMNQIGG